jgi:hypothetical protein
MWRELKQLRFEPLYFLVEARGSFAVKRADPLALHPKVPKDELA